MNDTPWVPKDEGPVDRCYICKKAVTPKTALLITFNDGKELMCFDCIEKLEEARDKQ